MSETHWWQYSVWSWVQYYGEANSPKTYSEIQICFGISPSPRHELQCSSFFLPGKFLGNNSAMNLYSQNSRQQGPWAPESWGGLHCKKNSTQENACFRNPKKWRLWEISLFTRIGFFWCHIDLICNTPFEIVPLMRLCLKFSCRSLYAIYKYIVPEKNVFRKVEG